MFDMHEKMQFGGELTNRNLSSSFGTLQVYHETFLSLRIQLT
jgi:hypothetical protein